MSGWLAGKEDRRIRGVQNSQHWICQDATKNYGCTSPGNHRTPWVWSHTSKMTNRIAFQFLPSLSWTNDQKQQKLKCNVEGFLSMRLNSAAFNNLISWTQTFLQYSFGTRFCEIMFSSHQVHLLGKPPRSKTDEFSENFRTAFDSPPRPFFERYIAIFSANRLHQH